MGSLTGAVASQKVTEAPKGSLRMVGNHSQSVKAQASLTARQTGRAGTKVGLSDPVVRVLNVFIFLYRIPVYQHPEGAKF